MATINEFLHKHEPKFKEYLLQRLASLDKEIEPLINEKKEIQAALDMLSGSNLQGKPEKSLNSYNSRWSTLEKVIHLTRQNGYLTSGQLIDLILQREVGADKKTVKNRVSAGLGGDAASEKPKLTRKLNTENKFEYMAK